MPTHMGLHTGGCSSRQQNHGAVPVEQIVRVVPIVQLGNFPDVLTAAAGAYARPLAHARLLQGQQTRRHLTRDELEYPWQQLNRGPIFALNAHMSL